MDATVIEKLRSQIENYTSKEGLEQVGRVISTGDGVAEIEGLHEVKLGEMVVFDEAEGRSLEEALEVSDPLFGMVLNLEEELVKVVILGEPSRVWEGELVKSTGQILSVPAGEQVVGRVLDPLGAPLDGKGAPEAESNQPIERAAYGVIDRQEVNTPVHTGVKAIDGIVPIGRGQRELIIGDRFTGKTTLAIDTILNQLNEPEDKRPICIYVAIGQKASKTAGLEALLRERGAMDYTTIISADAATSAALQYLAPFAAAAVGEHFMDAGRDVVVVYDDLSKHAVAYRQLSLLLRRPPGREAYPGDIFYLHSRLLERAAKLSDEKGGGSITALPIIETKEGDISAYIPTNVISITDGQIFLNADSFNKNVRPAINVGQSVSRVGSSAQTKAMKKVAGKIRVELAQFHELEAFMQFSQDLDSETKNRIERGRRLSAILGQDKYSPLGFQRQVPVIYAATGGYFAGIAVSRILEAERTLLDYLDRNKPEIFSKLTEEKALTDEIDAMLSETLGEFQKTHPDLYTESSAEDSSQETETSEK